VHEAAGDIWRMYFTLDALIERRSRPTRRGLSRAPIAAIVVLALALAARAGPAIHYAPAENLEHIDVALIDTPGGKLTWRLMS
jgi:hypothetical protein